MMYGGAGYPMPVTTTVPTSVDSTPMQTKRNMDYFFSHLGEEPVQLYCSTCRTNVLTNVTYRPGLLTWLMSALGCCCCLCCVPFCMTSLKDAAHLCPNCGTNIGTKKKISS